MKSFDDFEIRLGDTMRGERATMGKSLLDVQRDLRIKAAFIAAIENCDTGAFDTPGFVSGYVKSYARYLNMDPEDVFRRFCTESGFRVVQGGMSAKASGKRAGSVDKPLSADRNPFTSPDTPFIPTEDSLWRRIEPGAIGSTLVLLAMISGIGYGGWAVLKEVQQVQVAPVDETPVALSELDPLVAAQQSTEDANPSPDALHTAESLDRLYRPQALDMPVLEARDAAIATLDPRTVGAFRTPELPPELPDVQGTGDQLAPVSMAEIGPPIPQVLEEPASTLRMVTVRPSWVRVSAADGTVIFEGIMNAGESYDVPATEEPPTLRAGESGAVYFAIGDQHFGPVGRSGSVTSNIALSVANVTTRYALADLAQDRDLARMVAEAQAALPTAE